MHWVDDRDFTIHIIGFVKSASKWTGFNFYPCISKLLEAPLRVISRSPLLRQLPAHGGGEDGLAEAFEDFRDAFEAGFGAFHLGQKGVEFFGDGFLFG